MTCREVIGFLGSYVDEELRPDIRRRFEEHLVACPTCSAYLDTYRRTVHLAKDSVYPPDAPLPDQIPEVLAKAILAARRKRGPEI
jgi:anti-sigma factor RsiW